MAVYKSDAHKRWGRVIEGQIRDCIQQHPEYFASDPKLLEAMRLSLSKRIVGEIVSAGGGNLLPVVQAKRGYHTASAWQKPSVGAIAAAGGGGALKVPSPLYFAEAVE